MVFVSVYIIVFNSKTVQNSTIRCALTVHVERCYAKLSMSHRIALRAKIIFLTIFAKTDPYSNVSNAKPINCTDYILVPMC